MAKLIFGLFLASCLSVFGDSIPVLYGTNADFQGNGQALRWNELFPLDTPTPTGTNTIHRDRIRFTNDASGGWSITNVYPGNYRREFHGKFTITTNWYEFPSTNGAVNADDPTYARSATNGITQALTVAAGNARFILTQGLNQATNSPIAGDALGTPDGTNLAWIAGSSGNPTTNASDLVTGILDDARLSGNVALKNGANVFTASNYIGGAFVGNAFGETNQIGRPAIIVQTNGNDSTGGRFRGPFLTIAAGLSAAQYGDVVQAEPGMFTGEVTVPAGVTLAGRGACVTIITNTPLNGHKGVTLLDNSRLINISVIGTVGYGAATAALCYPVYVNGTNCTIFGVTAVGDSDGYSAPTSPRTSAQIINSEGDSFYDAGAFKGTDDGTNSTLLVMYSKFRTHGDVTNLYGVYVGDGESPTSSGNNFVEKGHAMIVSGYYDGTNAGFTAIGCLFDSQDSVGFGASAGLNYALDIGGDDDSGGKPTYAKISGCTFVSKFRTNLVDQIIDPGGGLNQYPHVADIYISSGSVLEMDQPLPVAVTNRNSTIYGGDGGSLTNLNASTLLFGTVPPARLASIPNAALQNSGITFSDGAGIGGSGSPTSLGGTYTVSSSTASPRFGSLTLNRAIVGGEKLSVSGSVGISGNITNEVLTASKLVGTDTGKALTSVTVGSGLTLSAGTLSASGSGSDSSAWHFGGDTSPSTRTIGPLNGASFGIVMSANGVNNTSVAEFDTIGNNPSVSIQMGQASSSGGSGNFDCIALGNHATIANTALTEAMVAGGGYNTINSSGNQGFISGGRSNLVSGQYGWAGGYRAKSINTGAYVWGDSTEVDKSTSGSGGDNNSYNVFAQNGIRLLGPTTYALQATTKTANYTVLTNDCATYFNNNGAAGTVTNTLPASRAGLHFSFTILTAQNMTVQAAGSDTIRNAATVSASGGFVNAATVGNSFHLYCPVAGQWLMESVQGTWTLH